MVRIELELINAEGVIQTDEEAATFRDMILPNALNECTTADSYLAEIAPDSEQGGICCYGGREETLNEVRTNDVLVEKLKTAISRSIRVSDKYLRLLSLLVKSREFHMAYPTTQIEGNLPVIELPKTREGKPFIPTSNRKGGSSADHHNFSISHQHPFLGIARAKGVDKVGMDIVTFDPINTRLYKNEQEFVNVFQSHFAETEWNSIVDASSSMREFYLQWAIKEAYTKALGLGMSMDFKSFTTQLDGVDGVWDHVLANADPQKGIILQGSVIRSQRPVEAWTFMFYPLRSSNVIRGCACVCVGPSGEGNSEDCPASVDASWMEVEELLEWHENRPGSQSAG
jgi:4'-phosphopantetheinyl transferase